MDLPFEQDEVQDRFLRDMQADPVMGHLVPRINEPMVQHMLFKSVFKYYQFYDHDEGFFSYDIREPYTRNIRMHYLLQEDSQFSEEWYTACDDYIEGLSLRDLYILRRYTRHGDEIVNALLRQPDTFAKKERVQTLFFKSMPNESQMLYAMQLIDIYAPGEYGNYVTAEGDLKSVEYREIQEMEREHVGDMEGLEMSVILERVRPLIEEYIHDLRAILRRAPPLPGPLQVFRASGTDYLNNPYDSAVIHGFVSTSLDSCIGEIFHQNNYVYQLILQPGVPCLSIKKASKYPAEFEVLIDTGCFANSSPLVGKHTLQSEVFVGDVDPEHILIGPKNIQHKTRTIQVIADEQQGGRVHKAKGIVSLRVSKARSKSRSRKGSKQGKKVTSRRVSKGVSKRPTTRSSRSRSSKRTMPWKDRDLLPPRVEYGKVPAAIHKRLLEAHKKMGTDFHNIAR